MIAAFHVYIVNKLIMSNLIFKVMELRGGDQSKQNNNMHEYINTMIAETDRLDIISIQRETADSTCFTEM